jgi:uncharacterized membrane protein
MAGTRSSKEAVEPTAGQYAKEALSQWLTAARLGAASLAPGVKETGKAAKAGKDAVSDDDKDKPPLGERLNPAKTDKGGAMGTAADKLLSKMGAPGKLASKVALGSRLTERLTGNGAANGDDASEHGITVPIQESMEVAVPVALAYRLCTRFDEYPTFLERAEQVEQDGDNVEFVAKIRGRHQQLEIEVFDARPNERLDWRSTSGIEHSGSVTFHELAPRLTHIELSVDVEPEGLVQRLARGAHLPDRVVRAEMHRFKAYAELYEDEDGDDWAEDAGEETGEDQADDSPEGEENPDDVEDGDDSDEVEEEDEEVATTA